MLKYLLDIIIYQQNKTYEYIFIIADLFIQALSLSQERSVDEQVMLTFESMCMVIPQSVLMKDSMYFKALFNEDWR